MSSEPRDDRSSERRDREESTQSAGTESRRTDRQPADEGVSAWFANVAVRVGLAVIGLIIVIFALGQAVGLDLLGLFAEAVSSQTGRWLVVAFFGLLLIAAAQRGLTHRG